MFGVLYGLSTVALYALLGRAGVPTFYDKLLQVPVLNLSIQLLDRVARSRWLRAFDPAALGRAPCPATAPSRLHRALGGRVHPHERRPGRWRSSSRPVGAVFGKGPAVTGDRMPVGISPICT